MNVLLKFGLTSFTSWSAIIGQRRFSYLYRKKEKQKFVSKNGTKITLKFSYVIKHWLTRFARVAAAAVGRKACLGRIPDLFSHLMINHQLSFASAKIRVCAGCLVPRGRVCFTVNTILVFNELISIPLWNYLITPDYLFNI